MNKSLKLIKLRMIAPFFMLISLMAMLQEEKPWNYLFFIGLFFLTIWSIIRAVYIRFILKGILYAEEKMDTMWGLLYTIYLLFGIDLKGFPYRWLEQQLHIKVYPEAITVIGSILAFVIVFRSLSAILRPYKQLIKRLKPDTPILKPALITLLSDVVPSRRYEREIYIEAIIERLKMRKKLFELEREGKKYLLNKKTAAKHNVTHTGLSSESITSQAFVAAGYENMATKMKVDTEREWPEKIDEKQQTLSLLRQNFSVHPLHGQNRNIKRNYLLLLFGYLELGEKHRAALDHLQNQYAKLIGLDDEVEFNTILQMIRLHNNQNLMDDAFRDIKKSRVKVRGWKFSSFTLKHALFAEWLFLSNSLGGVAPENKLVTLLAQHLNIRTSDYANMVAFCTALQAGEFKASQLLLQAKFRPSVRAQLRHLYHRAYVSNQIAYGKHHRTAVIATMSAGKSTFINAISGINLLPSKSQACTAKITTLLVNNEIDHRFGVAVEKTGVQTYKGIIDPSTIENWNQTDEIEALYVEGPMHGIAMDGIIPVLIDTPGTNNSLDSTHGEITYRFMQKQEFDSIVYLINATQISTDDDIHLRKRMIEIWKEGGGKQEILFLLNRIDEFDLEGEDDVAQSVSQLVNELKASGIEQPKVIPVSAYAAKLFRMAISGVSMSKKENKDYEAFCRLFIQDAVDFTSYAFPVLGRDNEPDERESEAEGSVSTHQLELAIKRTGIKLAERTIAEWAKQHRGE